MKLLCFVLFFDCWYNKIFVITNKISQSQGSRYTVEPLYNEVLGTMKITLLYQVSHYIRVNKQRNIKSWDQQNYLVIRGFCYTRPLYNEVPLYCVSTVYIASFAIHDGGHPRAWQMMMQWPRCTPRPHSTKGCDYLQVLLIQNFPYRATIDINHTINRSPLWNGAQFLS